MLFVITLVFSIIATESRACTSVLVSGRATVDGRPLLLKNRDTSDTDNLTIIDKGGKYSFIAIVAANDVKNESTWSGHNAAGFAIINTAAYNLNVVDGKTAHDDGEDGKVMRRALGECATLADFEALLDSIQQHGGLNCNSNFGVIDAQGGCAYYEVGNKGWVKFDANDPAVAPNGYLVRTNFGETGLHSLDQGVERYAAITDLMTQHTKKEKVSAEWLIRDVPRYLVHGLTRVDLNKMMPASDKAPMFVAFRDFIPRYLTASAVVVQGVKKGENPAETVSWTIAGWPLGTVALPLVLTSDKLLPQTITRNAQGYAPLVHAGLELKHRLFPNDRGNGHDYLNLAGLINAQGTGVLQRIQLLEDTTTQKGEEMLALWRKRHKASDVAAYYHWFDNFVRRPYAREWGCIIR